MRVNIEEIHEGGLEREWDLSREAVDEIISGDPAGYRARAPLHLDGRFEKVERRVLLKARGRLSLSAPCGRCLATTQLDLPLSFSMTFVPDDDPREGAEHAPDEHRPGRRSRGTFDANEVDEERYSGRTIDVDPLVREQILLAVPGYPVCQEECKGLCPVCGANLNERECGCERRVPDPRWAGLEKLRQKAKEE